MPSHSFPPFGGESCTRSSPVTTSISPCALTFTPATRSPDAITALTALVRSRWRKVDDRLLIRNLYAVKSSRLSPNPADIRRGQEPGGIIAGRLMLRLCSEDLNQRNQRNRRPFGFVCYACCASCGEGGGRYRGQTSSKSARRYPRAVVSPKRITFGLISYFLNR